MGNQTSHTHSSVNGSQQQVNTSAPSTGVLRDATNEPMVQAGACDIKDTSLLNDNDATHDYGIIQHTEAATGNHQQTLLTVTEDDTENNHRSMMLESVIKLNGTGGRTSMSPALTLTPIPPSPFAKNTSPSPAKAAAHAALLDSRGQTSLAVPTQSHIPLTPRSMSHVSAISTNPAQVLDFDSALATPSVREPMIRYLAQQHQRPYQLQSPVAMEIDFGESHSHSTEITSSPLPPAMATSVFTAERAQPVVPSPSFGPASTLDASLASPLVLASEHVISPSVSSSSATTTSSATRGPRVRIHPTNSYTPPDVLAKLMHATPLQSAAARSSLTSPQLVDTTLQQLSPIPLATASPSKQTATPSDISCASPLDSSPIIVELPTSPLDDLKESEPVAPLPTAQPAVQNASKAAESVVGGPATPASVRLLRSASNMLLDAQQLLKDVEQIKYHVTPPTAAPSTKISPKEATTTAEPVQPKPSATAGQAFIDPELLAFFTPASVFAAKAVSPISIQSLQHTGDASSSSDIAIESESFPMLESDIAGDSLLLPSSALTDPIPIEEPEQMIADEFEMLQTSPVDGSEATDPFADAATIGELEGDEEGCGFDFASMCFAPAASIIPMEAPTPLSETINSPSPRKLNSRGLRMKWRDLGSDRKSKPDASTLEDDFNYQCEPKLGITLSSPEAAPVADIPVAPVETEIVEEPFVHVESRRRSRRISSNFSAVPAIISPPKSSTSTAASITSPTVQMYKVLTKKTRRRSTSFDQAVLPTAEEVASIPVEAEVHETEMNDIDSSAVPAVSFSSSFSITATPRSILKPTVHPIVLLPEPSPVVLRRSSRRATTCEINFDSPPPAHAGSAQQTAVQQTSVVQKASGNKIKSPPPASAHDHAPVHAHAAVVSSPPSTQPANVGRSGRSVHDHCKSACSEFAPVPGMSSHILEKHHRSNSATRTVPSAAVNKKQRTSSITRKPLGDVSNTTAH